MIFVQVFISKIRNCKNKDEEKTTIDKELGKVRKKFTSGNAVTGALHRETESAWSLLSKALRRHGTGKDSEF